MAYEMRFYVVDKLKPTGEDLKFGKVIASYDYCCDYDLARFLDDKSKPTDCYIYINDDETHTDMYGDEITEISINDLLDYMESKPNKEYRRYLPFVAMLKGFKEIQENPNTEHFDNLVVLRYGY